VTATTADGESPFCPAVQNGFAPSNRPIIFPTPAMDCVNYFLTDTTIARSNFTWDAYPGALGYNVYAAPMTDPTNFSLFRENIPLSTLEIADQEIIVTAITENGETPKCAPIEFSSSCPESQDWLDRIAINGGVTPPIEEQLAVCDFISAMKAASLWDKMKSVIHFSPNGRATALTWLKPGLMSDTWVWNNPAEEINQIFSIDGFLPATFSDTTVIANQIFPDVNNMGVTGYASKVNGGPLPEILGAFVGARDMTGGLDNTIQVHPWKRYTVDPLFGYGFYIMCDWNFATFETPVPATQQAHNGCGFVSVNRLSPTDFKAYYAASDQPLVVCGSNAVLGTGVPPDGFFRFFESTNSNNYAGYCSFLALHDGLTQAEAAVFADIVQNFRMAIGGGYV
jgi:hypothetical protein